DGRTAQSSARDVTLDVHLEIERTGVDERQRGEGIRRRDCGRATEEGRARFFDNIGRGRCELGPDRHPRNLLDHLGDDRDEALILADIRSHVLPVHVWTRQIELESIGAGVLTRNRERLPVPELAIASRSSHDGCDQYLVWKRFLDALDPWDPPLERFVRDELPVPRRMKRRAAAFLHRQIIGFWCRANERRLW